MTIMLTLRFVFVLLCVFYLFQCEDEGEPITETRILRIHEIEAPETVSVSEESFMVTLRNTNIDSNEPEDIIECYERFVWDTNRQDNQLNLILQASSTLKPEDGVCDAEGGNPLVTYTVAGPFQVGDFRIIIHQPDGSTIEETTRIIEQ